MYFEDIDLVQLARDGGSMTDFRVQVDENSSFMKFGKFLEIQLHGVLLLLVFPLAVFSCVAV